MGGYSKNIPQCPHCGKNLPRMRYKFMEDEGVRRVLRLARRRKHISELSRAYAGGRNISRLSARKAIERLVKSGHLIRLGEGFYQTHPQGDP